MIYTKNVWDKGINGYKNNKNSFKKDVDKNNAVMYNHFCVTPNGVT